MQNLSWMLQPANQLRSISTFKSIIIYVPKDRAIVAPLGIDDFKQLTPLLKSMFNALKIDKKTSVLMTITNDIDARCLQQMIVNRTIHIKKI
jgi:hypothetical protein